MTHAIGRHSQSHIREDLFHGKVPKFVIIGLLSHQAFNGDYKQDSLEFQHFNLNFMGLYYNGQSVPYRTGYKPDFDNNKYARDYFISIVQNMEHMRRNVNNGITMDQWVNKGRCFFTFNLTPDFAANQAQIEKKGNIRLELNFSKPLEKTINVVVLGIFDATIQVTKEKRILR